MDGPPPADPVARAAGLAEAVAAAADEIERTQRVPPALLDRLHEARLYRLLLPASCGGEEIAPDLYMRAVEAVSRGDASVGWNMFVANSSALIAPFVPAGVAAEIFADPRAIISWGPPNRHVATAVAGGYRISGRWDFASGCRQATWMGAHAQVVEPDGSLRLNAGGRAYAPRRQRSRSMRSWPQNTSPSGSTQLGAPNTPAASAASLSAA